MTDIQVAKKFVSMAQRAKDRKIQFELSWRRFNQLLKIKYCFYTGIPFEKEGPFSKTFERLKSNKGYTDSNTVVCCQKLNFEKGNLDPEIIAALFYGLKRKGLV